MPKDRTCELLTDFSIGLASSVGAIPLGEVTPPGRAPGAGAAWAEGLLFAASRKDRRTPIRPMHSKRLESSTMALFFSD